MYVCVYALAELDIRLKGPHHVADPYCTFGYREVNLISFPLSDGYFLVGWEGGMIYSQTSMIVCFPLLPHVNTFIRYS